MNYLSFFLILLFILVIFLGITLASGFLGMMFHKEKSEDQTTISQTTTTTTEETPAVEEEPQGTVSQINALHQAKNYLQTAAFSEKGF